MTTPLYTVIGAPRSRAMRVMLMLEELGLPYDLLPLLPHSPELLAINPTGKIPAMRIGEEILLDSVAICQYLADAHHRFTYPAGTLERARQDSFTQFVVDEVEGPLWLAGRHSFVLPEDKRVPAVKETAKWEFNRSMKTLERRLGDNAFVMGAEPTVPDVLLNHAVGWARSAKFTLPGGPVGAYFERLQSRPATQRALERAARESA